MAKRQQGKGKRSGSASEGGVDGKVAAPVRKADEPEQAAGREVADGVYRRVGQEVLSGNLDPVCWAKALTESKGGRDEALTVYARLRTGDLTTRVGPEMQKKEKLQCRVARAYRENTDAPPLGPIDFQKAGGMKRAMDAIFWHCVAGLAAVGCLMAAQIIWPELRAHLTVNRLVMIVLAFQAFPTIGWFAAGRNGFYSVLSYSEAAHMSACVAIAASVGIGGYLLVGGQSDPVEFSPRTNPGSLLVVMPEEQLVRPVVHATGVPAKTVEFASAEDKGR